MKTVHKKSKGGQPLAMQRKTKESEKVKSIRIYFVDNGELRDQIENDAKKFGMSLSIMANLYIRAGRPIILNALDKTETEESTSKK